MKGCPRRFEHQSRQVLTVGMTPKPEQVVLVEMWTIHVQGHHKWGCMYAERKTTDRPKRLKVVTWARWGWRLSHHTKLTIPIRSLQTQRNSSKCCMVFLLDYRQSLKVVVHCVKCGSWASTNYLECPKTARRGMLLLLRLKNIFHSP